MNRIALAACKRAPHWFLTSSPLDANPLQNVRNVARIRAVFLGTRVYDRRALDELLTNAVAEAARN